MAKVGRSLLVASGRDVHGGEHSAGVEQRGSGHLLEHPFSIDHVLRAHCQSRLFRRTARVKGLLIEVVVGLDDVPVSVDLAMPFHRGLAAAQPSHPRCVRHVTAAAVHCDHCAFIRSGASHDEVAWRHEVQLSQPLDGSLKVWRGLHDLARIQHEALATSEEPIQDGGVHVVEPRVLLEAPATEAHCSVDANSSWPVHRCEQGPAVAHEDNLDGDIRIQEGAAVYLHAEATVVQIAAMDHGSIRHGRK
mmetsp:Transcript_36668/g.87779  ORF Transcript_36668/g.87779 Transcript_36668/m.87779 type:complete len:248 (+) Transcript_36668:278-1021(+)